MNGRTKFSRRKQIKEKRQYQIQVQLMSFLYDVRGTGRNLTSAFATHVFHLVRFYQSLSTLLLRRVGEPALKACALQISSKSS